MNKEDRELFKGFDVKLENIGNNLNNINREVGEVKQKIHSMNGVVAGIIKKCHDTREDLYGKTNSNTNFRYYILGASAGVSALIYLLFRFI